jgi:hypothetical protein
MKSMMHVIVTHAMQACATAIFLRLALLPSAMRTVDEVGEEAMANPVHACASHSPVPQEL